MARRRFDSDDVSRVVLVLFAVALVAGTLHRASWWQLALGVPIALGALVLRRRRERRVRARPGDPG